MASKFEDAIKRIQEGEGERRANAGIIGDLFNVLARPSRAVATATLYGTDKDRDTSALQGIAEGLSGKSKASFSDVFRQQGVSGPAAPILGFAADVLADPLTYVGVKNVRGTNAADALTGALRSGASNVEREAARLQALNPGHAYATLFGKRITPKVSTQLARSAKDALIGDEGSRRTIAKAFSKQSELPFGLADSASIYESGSAAGFHSHVREIRNVFKDLTSDERARISHAIESGEDLAAVPTTLKNSRFSNLGEAQLLAKNILDQYFKDEVKLGILKSTDYNPNYVYRYFRNPPSDMIPGAVEEIRAKVGGPDKAQFALKRVKDVSLAKAKEQGYDPVEDIAQILEIRSAKHYRTVGRAQFVNDAVERFGVARNKSNASFLRDKGWLRVDEFITNPVTNGKAGVYLPRPVVEAINTTERVLRDGTVGSKFMKSYDKMLREWKFLNTGVSPGYHIRNTFTDALMNFADGAVNPSLYKRAGRVLFDTRAKNATSLQDYLSTGMDLGRPIGTTKVRIGKHLIDSQELWEAYGRHGGKSGFISTELEQNIGSLAKAGITKYASNVKRVIGDASQEREDFFRLAHFIDATEKGLKKGRTLEKAYAEAAQRVRKYNIDYTGLSSFERNTVSKVVPFYAFMRKNLPLQMELLFTKPGFMSLYPKGQDLFQGLLGTETAEGESLIPRWIRESAPVRLAMAKKEANSPLSKLLQGLAGAKPGEAVFAPTLGAASPIGDLNQIIEPLNRGMEAGPIAGFQEAARNALNMVTPAIKAPVEIATGQNLYTGSEINGAKEWGEWLASQVGPTRVASRSAGGNPRALAMWATGLPLQPVSEARQEGEFKRREDQINKLQRRSKLQALQGIPNYNALPPQAQENLLRRVNTPESITLKQWLDQLRPKTV